MMSDYGAERPGLVEAVIKEWKVWCGLCRKVVAIRPTYQEGSIALTEHLDQEHPGWERG